MSEQQTPILEQTASVTGQTEAPGGTPSVQAAPPEPPTQPPSASKKKRRRKKRIGSIIGGLIALIVLLGGGIATWYFVFREPPEEQGETLTAEVYTGSISSTVEGSGLATAKDSATLTITDAGTISAVYVSEGDQVNEGDPLYTISTKSETAEKALEDAQETYRKAVEELNDISKDLNELVVRAPHAGKLMEVKDLKVGDDMSKGDVIATLVNDTQLRLHLYYNYTYENDIQTGQSAQITIPAVMGSFDATVEVINKVSRIFPEGGKGFEVVFLMDNPETLTAGMDASAALTAADGTPIYPYESGQLEYYETTEIKTKAAGPVEQFHLLNYADVKAGDTLLVLGDDEIADDIASQQKVVDEAAEKVSKAQEDLSDVTAKAPISGTIFSCVLHQDQEVKSGDAAVTISDTSSMSVEISVDDRNIRYISVGQMIDLNDWDGNMFTGVVESVDLNGKSENGMTIYPVKLAVDNADGTLVNGIYLNYSFTASQSENCLIVPVQAVNSVSDVEGNLISVVYLQAQSQPETVVEVPEEVTSSIPEGFYPVQVEVGLSDVSNVEIKSGVNEGDVVFLGYQKNSADGW